MRCCAEGSMNRFCASLCDETRRVMCAVSRETKLKRGDIISAAAVSDYVGIVQGGALAMMVNGSTAEGIVASFVAFSGALGSIQRLAGEHGSHKAAFNEGDYGYALVPSSICLVPLDTIRDLFVRDSDFAFKVFVQSTDQYRDALERLAHVGSLPVKDRVRWLFGTLEQHGVDTSRVTHEQIAHVLGVNRVTVTKLMKSL
ncbi:MAG: Crp/Fnr family transcriptional regulator [Gordonibacter sp.]|uniref:Crp/Fnr family transcriptional regulator n=1 Tax=Gordonibacter sp. TaxID=1968902 RepID=UPI002FCB5844